MPLIRIQEAQKLRQIRICNTGNFAFLDMDPDSKFELKAQSNSNPEVLASRSVSVC